MGVNTSEDESTMPYDHKVETWISEGRMDDEIRMEEDVVGEIDEGRGEDDVLKRQYGRIIKKKQCTDYEDL